MYWDQSQYNYGQPANFGHMPPFQYGMPSGTGFPAPTAYEETEDQRLQKLQQQSRMYSQQQLQMQHVMTPQANIPVKSFDEKEFDAQFNEWNRQYENWREQNKNHPDKAAFEQYDQQWQNWRSQLLERRTMLSQTASGNPPLPPSEQPPAPAQPPLPAEDKPPEPPSQPGDNISQEKTVADANRVNSSASNNQGNISVSQQGGYGNFPSHQQPYNNNNQNQPWNQQNQQFAAGNQRKIPDLMSSNIEMNGNQQQMPDNNKHVQTSGSQQMGMRGLGPNQMRGNQPMEMNRNQSMQFQENQPMQMHGNNQMQMGGNQQMHGSQQMQMYPNQPMQLCRGQQNQMHGNQPMQMRGQPNQMDGKESMQVRGGQPNQMHGNQPTQMRGQPNQMDGKELMQMRGGQPNQMHGNQPTQMRGQPNQMDGKESMQMRGGQPNQMHGNQPTQMRGLPNQMDGNESMQMRGSQPNQMHGNHPSQVRGNQPNQTHGDQPMPMRGNQPNQMRGNQPMQVRGSQPNQIRGNQPMEVRGSQPMQVSGSQPNQIRGIQPMEVRGSQPSQLPGNQAMQVRGSQPNQLTQVKGNPPTQVKGNQPNQIHGSQPMQMKGGQPMQVRGSEPNKMQGNQPVQARGSQPNQPMNLRGNQRMGTTRGEQMEMSKNQKDETSNKEFSDTSESPQWEGLGNQQFSKNQSSKMSDNEWMEVTENDYLDFSDSQVLKSNKEINEKGNEKDIEKDKQAKVKNNDQEVKAESQKIHYAENERIDSGNDPQMRGNQATQMRRNQSAQILRSQPMHMRGNEEDVGNDKLGEMGNIDPEANSQSQKMRFAENERANFGINPQIQGGGNQTMYMSQNQPAQIRGSRPMQVRGGQPMQMRGNQQMQMRGNQPMQMGGNQRMNMMPNQRMQGNFFPGLPRMPDGSSMRPAGPRMPVGSPMRPAGPRMPVGSPMRPASPRMPVGSPMRPTGPRMPDGSPMRPAGPRMPDGFSMRPIGPRMPDGSPMRPTGPRMPDGATMRLAGPRMQQAGMSDARFFNEESFNTPHRMNSDAHNINEFGSNQQLENYKVLPLMSLSVEKSFSNNDSNETGDNDGEGGAIGHGLRSMGNEPEIYPEYEFNPHIEPDYSFNTKVGLLGQNSAIRGRGSDQGQNKGRGRGKDIKSDMHPEDNFNLQAEYDYGPNNKVGLLGSSPTNGGRGRGRGRGGIPGIPMANPERNQGMTADFRGQADFHKETPVGRGRGRDNRRSVTHEPSENLSDNPEMLKMKEQEIIRKAAQQLKELRQRNQQMSSSPDDLSLDYAAELESENNEQNISSARPHARGRERGKNLGNFGQSAKSGRPAYDSEEIVDESFYDSDSGPRFDDHDIRERKFMRDEHPMHRRYARSPMEYYDERKRTHPETHENEGYEDWWYKNQMWEDPQYADWVDSYYNKHPYEKRYSRDPPPPPPRNYGDFNRGRFSPMSRGRPPAADDHYPDRYAYESEKRRINPVISIDYGHKSTSDTAAEQKESVVESAEFKSSVPSLFANLKTFDYGHGGASNDSIDIPGKDRERERDRELRDNLRGSSFGMSHVDKVRSRENLREEAGSKRYSEVDVNATSSHAPNNTPTKAETVLIEDLLCNPGRLKRPRHILIILRGLPGSGKSFVAKLMKDKEIENGGSAPRMLCLDDYFMNECDKVIQDPETGRKIKKKEMVYEYEAAMEPAYRLSLFKSLQKNVDNGLHPFIIIDAPNERVKHFSTFVSFAKSKGYAVFIAEMENTDPSACHKKNIHDRTMKEITQMVRNWQPTPKKYVLADIRSLLQDASITEVEMEDHVSEDENSQQEVAMDDEPADHTKASKWETMEATEAHLYKLDGLRKRRTPQKMEDYLQLPDDYCQRTCEPGKKRVRWKDLEERKNQELARAIGFVVGQTDWEKITDPNHAEKALTHTKYI